MRLRQENTTACGTLSRRVHSLLVVSLPGLLPVATAIRLHSTPTTIPPKESEMAQYIVEGTCFINGSVQDPAEDGRPPHVITVPDDFVPGFFLRPVDEPAKKAFAKYEASKLGLTAM